MFVTHIVTVVVTIIVTFIVTYTVTVIVTFIVTMRRFVVFVGFFASRRRGRLVLLPPKNRTCILYPSDAADEEEM
ncbi:hypothetical protein SB3_29665 [Methylobacterium radiotolerans]|nr:hypothetical protein SB3_29665 [Methylobacterium radiotolerans]